MRREVRRKLEMGARVREFSKAHPSDAATAQDAAAELDELLRKADVAQNAERAGRLEELSATNRKSMLRRSTKFELLHHLVTIGRLAGEEDPKLAGKFYLRSSDATHATFLSGTRQMIALAEANKELMARKGLNEEILTALGATMAQFDEAMGSGRAGRQERIRALGELEDLADQVGRAVGVLDGVYRFTLRGSPDLLRVWEAIRVIGPRSVPSPVESPKGGGGETPPSGGVAAA